MKLDVSNIPELSFFPDWKVNNEAVFTLYLEKYQEIIDFLLELSSDDINMIQRARAAMKVKGIGLHSASDFETGDFVTKLQEKRESVKNIFKNVFSFDSGISGVVTERLREMLEKGSKLALNNIDATPVDNDPIWDQVIWGHTQARENVEKEVLTQFLISHYLSQYVNYTLGKEFSLFKKDDFINVLADVILLRKAQGNIDTKLYQAWSTSKQNGGLGWIDDNQLDVYVNIVESL